MPLIASDSHRRYAICPRALEAHRASLRGQEVMGGHRRATVVYDLTPKGIIDSPGLLNVDYNKVSAYGHFGKAELPWKK